MITFFVHVWSCSRCACMFVLVDKAEECGGHKRSDLLEANTCVCCGKGQVEYLGKVTVAP